MRVLIISAFFPPENAIGGYRAYYWAREWSRDGHEVDVLTIKKDQEFNDGQESFHVHQIAPQNFYNKLKSFYRKKVKAGPPSTNDTKKDSFFSKILSTIKNFLIQRGLGSSTRMPDPFDLWISPATKWAKDQNKKWDLVVSSFGPYACHLIARKIKKESSSTFWVADFRDTWVDSPYFKGFFPFTLYERYLEKRISHEADLISIVSQPLQDLLQKKYPHQDVICVENGFSPDELEQIDSAPYFSENEKSYLKISYAGTLYPEKRDPRPLFEALNKLRKTSPEKIDQVRVYFAGPPSEYLDSLMSEFEFSDSVQFLGKLTREQSLRLQRDSDILLFLETNDPSTPGVLTGKLFEYVFSKTPIWALGVDEESESSKVILETKTGDILGDDIDKISQKISEAIDNKPAKISHQNENLSKYTRRASAEKMLQEIRERYSTILFEASPPP